MPRLANRALEPLILLVVVLVVSCCGLIPEQPSGFLRAERLGIGLSTSFITGRLDRAMLRQTEQAYQATYRRNLLFTQLTVLLYSLAGALLGQAALGGLYWVVPASLFSFSKAMVDAWVLLVEINC